MTDKPRWFQTTAIDYPNSRPHIGTAFEKLGADVQARYRRMEGYDVRIAGDGVTTSVIVPVTSKPASARTSSGIGACSSGCADFAWMDFFSNAIAPTDGGANDVVSRPPS